MNATTDTLLTRPISGRARLIVLAAWSMLAAAALMAFVLSMPLTYVERLAQAYLLFQEALPQLGLTPEFYAGFFPAVQLVHAVISVALGFLIISRRTDEPIAVIVALALVVTGTQNLSGFNAWGREDERARVFLVALYAISYVLIFANLLLFPNGRFYPRWMRWVMVIILPLTVLDGLASIGRPQTGSTPASPFLIIMGLFGFLALWGQLRRFRTDMSPTQRQQVKWVLFGLFLCVVPISVFNMIDPFVTPWFAARPPLRVLYRFFIHIFLLYLPFTTFSVALAFSIFRYRLWDIDYAINRTLGIVLVTVLLVVLFLVGFSLLSTLIDSPIIIPVLAVALALLFNPVRARIQRVIDKQVYHLRYAVDSVEAYGRDDAKAAHRPAPVRVPGSLTGKMIGGYTLDDFIGRGGMGEVYRGHVGSETVAIKLLPGVADADTRVRFSREGEILQRLSHPNIVRFYEYGETEDGVRYMVMDYLDGTPLDKFLRQGGRLNVPTMRKILHDVSSALDYIHARGVVHRDLKPANIMLLLKPDGSIDRAVLMDFGIAKSQTTAITGTETMGTIDYMAPEQIQAAAAVDARTDVYALGVLLYEMLTGSRPFQGNAGQVLFAHLRQPPPNPRNLVPDLPEEVVQPVLRALSKQPDDRYARAGELAAALAA